MSLLRPPAALQRPRIPTLLSTFLTLLNDRLSESIFLPLLPFLLADFSSSGSTVGLLSGTYALSQFAVAPLIGALSDRFGRRPVITVCVAGSVVGMGLFAITLTLPWQQIWPGATAAGLPLMLLFLARTIDGMSGGTAATGRHRAERGGAAPGGASYHPPRGTAGLADAVGYAARLREHAAGAGQQRGQQRRGGRRGSRR